MVLRALPSGPPASAPNPGPRSAAKGLRVEVLTTIDALAGLKDLYEELLHASCNTLPFALHEWHVAWCRHFLTQSANVADEPRIYLVHDYEGICLGVVPMILTQRRMGIARIGSLTMLGGDPAITEIRAPLVRPGREAEVVGALRATLAKQHDWDWVYWTGMTGRFGEALATSAKLQWDQTIVDYVLDLPSSWEILRKSLKRNIRESLRHCYNSLKRDGIEFTMSVVTESDSIKPAIDRFLVLHEMRANLPDAVRHDNHFAREVSREFLHEICATLARRGIVRVFEMRIGGEIVASRVGYVVGDSLYLYYSGFAPRWAKYSVMTTTMAEAIKYAITCGLSTVNLSTTRDVAKTRWGPREIAYIRAYEVLPTLRAKLAWTAYRWARSKGLRKWVTVALRQTRHEWS